MSETQPRFSVLPSRKPVVHERSPYLEGSRSPQKPGPTLRLFYWYSSSASFRFSPRIGPTCVPGTARAYVPRQRERPGIPFDPREMIYGGHSLSLSLSPSLSVDGIPKGGQCVEVEGLRFVVVVEGGIFIGGDFPQKIGRGREREAGMEKAARKVYSVLKKGASPRKKTFLGSKYPFLILFSQVDYTSKLKNRHPTTASSSSSASSSCVDGPTCVAVVTPLPVLKEMATPASTITCSRY